MKPSHGIRGLISVALLMIAARAETWHTTRGEKFEGKLSGVYGPIAVVADKNGSKLLSVAVLGDVELGRVADYLATRPATIPWQQSTSPVAKALKGRLQVLRDGKLVEFDPGTRKEPEFYVVYFGAEWCPPCRAFSPRLVAASERLRKLAADRFEIIFVSSDRSGAEQLSYVKHVGMPWPVLKFSQIGRVTPLERWAGSGIPCLVVVTREGDALLHSYHGEEYVGPQFVLDEFENFLRTSDGKSAAERRLTHRLAVFQHIRAAAGAARSAAPYLVTLDLRGYQTLTEKELTATLTLNEKGEVTNATISPQLSTTLDYQLVQDAEKWLFLPEIENGRPVRKTVSLPLQIPK
jgi:thiol-disulfide isomerase/thioredoxin